jgi:hypothetical protein
MKPPTKYCKIHQKAYENLHQKFTVWQKTLNTDWKGYLTEVSKNTLTGKWAKEVAESLLSET